MTKPPPPVATTDPAGAPSGPGPASLDSQAHPSLASTLASNDGRPDRLLRGSAIGRYLVVEFIGEGGMGAVYSAYDPELDRKVAIKILKFVGETARNRLLREAQAMARVSHPNVIPVHDAGAFGEQVYVAMEFVEGRTLREWLGQAPRSRREILDAFLSAGEGLAAVHRAGLVHRDFKPDNVLVGADGRVRISDFGLAYLHQRAEVTRSSGSTSGSQELTVAGELLGTPAYMAPEQFAGGKVDPRTDQFAFCVALWEALCGSRPFAAEGVDALREVVLSGPAPEPPREARLPRWLKRMLVRGLSRPAADRYPALDELLVRLRRRQLTTIRRVAGWAVASAVVVAVGAWGGYRRHLEQTRCTREAEEMVGALWSPSARAAAQASLGALGAAAALEEIDASFAELGAAHREVCERARARSARVPVDRRAEECLAQHARRATAIVHLLGASSAELKSGLGPLIDHLRRPSRCLARATPGAAADPAMEPLLASIEEAKVLADVGRKGEAEQRLRALLPQARGFGAQSAASDVERALAEAIYYTAGPTDEVAELLRLAIRDADAAPADELSLLARVAFVQRMAERSEHHAAAAEMAADAEAWLRRLGNPVEAEVLYLTARSNLESRLGNDDPAVAYARRGQRLAQQAFGPESQRMALAHLTAASALIGAGRFEEAAADSQAALRAFQGTRWRDDLRVVVTLGNLATIEIYRGRGAVALEAVTEAAKIAAGLGENPAYAVWFDLIRSQALELLGRRAEAEAACDRVLAQPDLLDAPNLAEVLAIKARLLAARGDPTAEKRAREAVAAAATPGIEKVVQAEARFALAQALGDQPRARAEAIAAARQAAEYFDTLKDPHLRGEVRRWLEEHPPTK